jgi:hypothetical protein
MKYYIQRLFNRGEEAIYMPLYRPCWVKVPSDKVIEAITNQHNISYMVDPSYLWDTQDILEPKLGYTVRFTSESMDEGWWSISSVQAYETLRDGSVLIETLNSIYLATPEER